MAKNQPMEKKKKHFIAVTSSIILASLIVLITIVLAVTLTLPTGYTLVFNVDGQVTTSLEVKAKDEVVLADPAPKDGYTFGGWYFDNDTFAEPCTPETLKDKKLKGENTIYAKWIKNDYTIKYEVNGGENAKANPSGYAVDTATIKLAAPTKLGYTFGGWYGKADFKDKAVTEIAKGSTGNKTLFAKWIKNDYTITYNLDGGENAEANPSGYVVDTATITLAAPTKLGYTFDGWYSEDTFATQLTEIATGSTGNKILFAKWTKNDYTITYNLDGGINGANATTYTIDTATITLADPTWVGCIFGGWYDNAEFKGNAITEIAKGSTGNKTLFAKWTAIEYGITYNLNDGVLTGTYPTTYTTDKITTLAIPTKLGYTFDGWCEKSDLTDTPIKAIAKGTISDKTFYAKWTKTNYTITYNLDGGINGANPTTYTIDTATITLATPTKVGYTFDGWYSEDSFATKVTEIAIGSTENKTLFAKWTAIEYGITYNLDGGTNSIDNPTKYTIENAITFASPTKSGYKFLGWFSQATGGVEVKQITTGGTGTITVFARWEIVNYGITYELNGGSNNANNPATYTVLDSTIQLQTPTYNGNWMTFDGWFEDDTFTTQINQILTTPTGNKKVYAKWDFIGTEGLMYTLSADNKAYEVSGQNITSATVGIPSKHNKLPVKMGSSAFKNNNNITSVVIEEGVPNIGIYAFYSCKSLTSVTIPDGVLIIGMKAFYACSALVSVSIPSTVTQIWESAFFNCSALKSVTIPNSVKSIGNDAFNGCMSLQSVNIPDGVTSIGDGTFVGCTSFRSITIPNSVTSIGVNAFYGCTNLTSVYIPASVDTIGNQVFQKCTSLTNIFIPSSVTTMGEKVFEGCTNLTISCERASAPIYNITEKTGWYSNNGVYWYGNVPTGNIKWSQTRPKLVP